MWVRCTGSGQFTLHPRVYKARVTQVCLTAGHAPRAEVGGGIICVACWEFTGLHRQHASHFFGDRREIIGIMPYTLAIVGQLGLHGYYACMVYWAKGSILVKLLATKM